MTNIRKAILGIAGLLSLALPFHAFAQVDRDFGGEIELVDPDVLRVCADPNNMPYSNEKEQGYEQAIARLLADKLGRNSVSYTYYPQATGFVRMTLGSNLCDVIMSYPQGDELVQNTNPYYRTAYALVYPKDGDLKGVASIEDPKLKGKHIGVVAGTPPATYLARAGLIGSAKPYQLMVDTRYANSALEMIDDLGKGDINAAVLWGPLAGFYAKRADKDYAVVPLTGEKGGPATAFRITMGVRASDQEWKRTLNRTIRDNQDAINQILLAYGVPILSENDEPILSKDGKTAQEVPLPEQARDAEVKGADYVRPDLNGTVVHPSRQAPAATPTPPVAPPAPAPSTGTAPSNR